MEDEDSRKGPTSSRGPWSGLTVVGNTVSNCGSDGIRIEGFLNAQVEGNNVSNVGGSGVVILRHGTWMRSNGLPPQTDPIDLAELLERLQGKNPDVQEATVKESGFLKRLSGASINVTHLVSSVLTIAGSPQVQSIIDMLKSRL